MDKSRMKKFFSGFIIVAFVMIAFVVSASAQVTETYVVTSSNPQSWGFLAEGVIGKSDGGFVVGPAAAPAGGGSAMLSTIDSTGAHVLATARYGSTKLSSIYELKYSSYGNLSPQAIAFQFNVDSDVTDANNSFQGRLVFEPYQAYGNAAVVPNTWIEWNALTGKWWGSGGGASRPVSMSCPQSNPCTTAQLLFMYPNVGILDVGGVYFKVGTGWGPAFTGYVDKLVIGITTEDGNETSIWDFEEFSVATDPESCKKGGYLLFNPPTGPYKNQGQCVSSVVPQ
jgi:hypothetical protein